MVTGTMEVLRGAAQNLSIAPWENRGRTLVSVTPFYLTDTGEYHRRKGGCALSVAEPRELASALEQMAAVVEALPEKEEADE